jgi:putative DNA primase/helicase
VPTLHHSGGDYAGAAPRERLTDDAVRATVWTFLRRSATTRKAGAYRSAQSTARRRRVRVKAATYLDTVAPPHGYQGQATGPARVAGVRQRLCLSRRGAAPHTPGSSAQCAALRLQPARTKPAEWLAFLQSLWPDDPETIATLQEWMGYCLTNDTRFHKIMLLIGPKRSGKDDRPGAIGHARQRQRRRLTLGSLGGNFS